MYLFGLGLYIQRLDQIIVWSFSWLFITLSLLDAVVNHPYQYLLSYFDTFLAKWEVGHTQKTVVCDFPAFRKNRTGE